MPTLSVFMTHILENLEKIRRALDEKEVAVDHYEIRSPKEGYPAERSTGIKPLEALSDWNQTEKGEDYIIEVFLGDKNKLDRLLYDSSTERAEFISFSGNYDEMFNEILQELNENIERGRCGTA